jgi:alkanesulfonate monooxygenase SsuD/methylene tetrahydromethanopterin reductase-like flavin-dependent oxidoreductase (luciferase family)
MKRVMLVPLLGTLGVFLLLSCNSGTGPKEVTPGAPVSVAAGGAATAGVRHFFRLGRAACRSPSSRPRAASEISSSRDRSGISAIWLRYIRIGSLVTPVTMRHPLLLTHQIATVLDLAGPRLDVGLGAGWNEAEFTSAGLPFPAAPVRLAAVKHTATLLRNELGDAAPPIWVGGKRSGILRVTGETTDGWNLAWDPTPADYTRRLPTLLKHTEPTKDTTGFARSVGLTTAIGTHETDLHRQGKRLCRWAPGQYLERLGFERWRSQGLIGTPDEVRARFPAWESRGVDHIVCALGIPFGLFDADQLTLVSEVLRGEQTP